MRLFELQKYWTGWLNVNTGKIIKHERNISHVHAVIGDPSRYDIPSEDVEYDQTKIADWMLDGNQDIVNAMHRHGWVRVIIDDDELNVQAVSIMDVRKAAKIMQDKEYFKYLCYEMSGDVSTSKCLADDQIDQFIKYGK